MKANVPSILVVGTGSIGGIGRFEHLLIAALRQLSNRGALTFTSIWRRHHPDYLRASTDVQSDAGRHSVESRMPAFAIQIARAAARNRPDLVLFLHVNLARAAPVVRALGARRYGVVTYGVEVWSPLDSLRRTALHAASGVVAISEYTASQLVQHQGLASNRIRVVPLALEPHWLEQAAVASPPSERLAASQTGPRLLSVARLDPAARNKGIELVIRALPQVRSAIPEVTYDVVGDGADRLYLERLADECGVSDAVDFRGLLSQRDLVEEYRRADVFVLPSRSEGFGLVFLEAMVHATPVIARRAAAAVEVVADGSTGILVEDQGDLAPAIISVLSSPDRARDMGNAGAERVRALYSFEAFTMRIEAALLAAMGSALRHRRCACLSGSVSK